MLFSLVWNPIYPRRVARSARLGLACLAAAAGYPAPAAASPAGPVAVEAGLRLPLTVAYFGETVTHPGLLLGTEYPAWEAGWHRAFLAASAGGYRHPGNHTGLFVDGALGYRLTFPAGPSLEALVGSGYLRTWLDGPVYAMGPTGLGPVDDTGRSAWMPSFSLGGGIDGSGLGLAGTRLFTRVQLFGQYPYNGYVLPHLATQLGLTWHSR